MSGEGSDDVDVLQPDAEGKHPEEVPWDKYVGVKEAWGKAKGKVSDLEESLKKAPSAEEFTKMKTELDEAKTNLQKSSDELKGVKDKAVSELRETLKAKGIPEEELAEMSEKELNVLVKAVASYKPKPDLGGGGGSGDLKGSPMELARRGYEESGKSK